MSLEFYVTPEELKPWLSNLIQKHDVWCLASLSSQGGRQYKAIRDTDTLSFEGEYEDSLMLFVGKRYLSEIVWEETSRGKEFNFIKSQAIQIVPSTIIDDSILLEGRIAVMRKDEYVQKGIDSKPLLSWSKQVQKSLVELKASESILVQKTTTGKLKEWKEVIVSPGAVSWRRSGRLLKQFSRSEVEFDVIQKRES